MFTNKLALNIPDISTDCILRVEDLSVYQPLIPYSCPSLQVTVPGFKSCVTFTATTPKTVGKNFAFSLTACDLEIQKENCNLEYLALPDGVYVINYSHSPNESLYVEYNHLRTTAIRKKINAEWAKLKLSACEPIPETKQKFNELVEISAYIDAAKAAAEFELDMDKAMCLYDYANKLISNFSCKLR